MFKAPPHVAPPSPHTWGGHDYHGSEDLQSARHLQRHRSPLTKNGLNVAGAKMVQKRQRKSGDQALNASVGEASRKALTQHQQSAAAYRAPVKRRRTADDFLLFCKMVLDYENYSEVLKLREEETRKRHSSSPLGSTGSSSGSWTSGGTGAIIGGPKDELSDESAPEAKKVGGRVAADAGEPEDGWDQITCYCNKPYNGHPMVECTSCFTWVHTRCARLKRNRKIPDDWRCFRCRSNPTKEELLLPSSSSSTNVQAAVATSKVSGSRKRKSSTSKRRSQGVPSVEEEVKGGGSVVPATTGPDPVETSKEGTAAQQK